MPAWRAIATALTLTLPVGAGPGAGGPPGACGPGRPPVVRTGAVERAQVGTYRLLPVDVQPGTTRVDVAYDWADRLALPGAPPTATVLDLGLWDERGYRSVDGFRGWSGSRHRRVFVQAHRAERGYGPGPVGAGRWHVELGVGAVGPAGATWRVTVTCSNPPVGRAPKPDPVDARHVARAGPGWYHADFHMHGYHSNPRGPEWPAFVAMARAAGLDALPVTEYVVGWHWDELGRVQRANPDLLVWPGREIVTYHGHASALGETRRVLEYRHGFEDVTLAGIQRRTKADGALFQVNHPTFFPGPLGDFCRGCEFRLGDGIDWSLVDTLEVLTGPVLVDASAVGGPATPVKVQNPFVATAIRLWEDLLRRGYRVTAVSGSDSKGQDGGATGGYGVNATAVWADELSRPALVRAVRGGHAYVRTRGVAASPALELVATAGLQRGTFGDTLVARSARVRVTVTGGRGQLLRLVRNGDPAGVVPVTTDPFTYTFTATRAAPEGPLGTFWRVETLDARSLTTIGNPIFLADRRPDR